MDNMEHSEQIYDDWLFATKINITTLNNPLELLHDKYTLNGYSTMSQCYFNDSYNNEQLNNNKIAEESKKWTQEIIDKLINEIKNENYSNPIITYVDSGNFLSEEFTVLFM
uniref:Uncharacterized protein n=1 Tax=Meloidogyne hapla TaxID=6305 RepID=A0A1I8BZG7_MELHA